MSRALTPRQRQIIEAASRGLTGRQIADELGMPYDTVRTHAANIRIRLGAHNMTEACVRYERERAEMEARELLRQRILREVTAY